MTGAQALDLLMSRLGKRTDAATRALCLTEMVLAQATLENAPFLPWFLLTEDATAATVATERRVAVPSDFLREHDEGELLIQDSGGNWNELTKNDYDLLIDEFGFTATDDPPTKYATVGLYFCMFPIPSAVRSVKLTKYYGRDDAPVDGATENKWLRFAPDLLIAETGIQVSGFHIRDDVALGRFTDARLIAYNRLIAANTAREEANRTRAMGED